MRKTALLLALISAPAIASGNKPPDVPAFVPVAATYASGVAPNVVATGTPPAYAAMPANIATSPTTGWLVTTDTSYCTFGVPGDGSHGCAVARVAVEAKMRTLGMSTHIGFNDPIRNYGQPGTSHLHQFFGNSSTNAYSTYASLRRRPGSAMAGGVINATAYWFPCLIKTNPFSDGKNYCVKANNGTVYYEGAQGISAGVGDEVYMPRGLRFVFGTNMDDPDDLVVKAEIAAANAQPGTSGRYSYKTSGFVGWTCAGSAYKVALKNTDNSDPWAGACTSSDVMIAEAISPGCWDGSNLWSPSGYAHMRQTIRDNTLSLDVCPNNWYRVFMVRVKPQFTHSGFADYGSWRLSSDDMAATNAGHAMRNGESFHTDYLFGWDDTVLRTTEDFCIGANSATGHECDSSTLTATTRLITSENAPDGSRIPQVPTVTYGTASAGVMWQVPAATGVATTIHTGH